MQIKIFEPGLLGYKNGISFQESEWQVRDIEIGFFENEALYSVINCVEKGSIVASAAIKHWGGVFQIQSLIVKKGHRGRGIGKKLVEGIIAEANARNCHQVYVSTLSANSDSIKMYRKMGFKKRGEIRNTFFGQNLVILTKQI